MAKKQPKFDDTIDGVRVRVYATRSEFEALVGDGEIDDPEASVWCFPKIGTPDAWAHQAVLNHKAEAAKS